MCWLLFYLRLVYAPPTSDHGHSNDPSVDTHSRQMIRLWNILLQIQHPVRYHHQPHNAHAKLLSPTAINQIHYLALYDNTKHNIAFPPLPPHHTTNATAKNKNLNLHIFPHSSCSPRSMPLSPQEKLQVFTGACIIQPYYYLNVTTKEKSEREIKMGAWLGHKMESNRRNGVEAWRNQWKTPRNHLQQGAGERIIKRQ